MALTRPGAIVLLVAVLATPTPRAADHEATPRYQLTDQVLLIAPGTTMYALVWEHYPDYKNRWLQVAADLAEANPHAFRNGDPGDVIVGKKLTLIDYDSAAAPARPSATANDSAPAADAPDRPAPPRSASSAVPGDAPSAAADGESSPAGPVRIGRITRLLGELRAVGQDQRPRRLAVNDHVLLGDTLLAGPDGRVSLAMVDDAKLELARAAHVVFEDYVYQAPGARSHSTVTLLQGSLRITTGAIARDDPDAVYVNTPMATIGAHEADFGLLICASGACRRNGGDRPLLAGLYAGVLAGEVALANNTGKQTLKRGDFVRVRNQESQADPAVEAAELVFEPALLSGLDIRRDEPLGFWAWFRERFL